MNKRNLPAGLHLILGDCAAGVFRGAFRVRDQLLIDQDVLSCGPTPRCDDLAKWSQLRSEYWATLIPGEIDNFVPSPFNLVQQSHRLHDAEHVYVWAATGVSEQLFVAFVAHLVNLLQVDPARVSTVQFDQVSDRPEAALSPFGEAVLDGAAAYHSANPIDDWASGVRLSSADGAVWFRDGARLVRC